MEAKKELTVKFFQAEIAEASKTSPWHKINIMKCTELGVKPKQASPNMHKLGEERTEV